MVMSVDADLTMYRWMPDRQVCYLSDITMAFYNKDDGDIGAVVERDAHAVLLLPIQADDYLTRKGLRQGYLFNSKPSRRKSENRLVH